jgi:glycosyltransferase involved in cell wall biosynthesis
MRICLIGKFPPIQGGVSMRTYWAAHALAARGHEVHVVTNAKEVQPPFRMHMRAEDWRRCEASYGEGSVTVHWTDPVDRSQAYIPMASPFVSKLAAIAARIHAERPFDVILSFYLEPYGVAGYLAAQMTSVPHVVRTAGSDAGRLWLHPQLEVLYDHVLRSAACVITGNVVAARAVQRGVDADRIAFAGGVVVPEDIFTPVGPLLDLAVLRAEVASDPDLRDLLWGEFTGGRPYFGIYGKLGETKGSFALLAAMRRLKDAGLNVGLVAVAHGPSAVEDRFRVLAGDFGLTDRILQLPFLPHWRVPEFIRGCLAICCLEQDFPVRFHSPIVLREVLLCGTCLVAATEVIRKLPEYSKLPHGFGCVAIDDVNDVDMLTERLAAIVEDPAPASEVGARGREFACALQRNVPFPQELERALEAAVSGRRISSYAAQPLSDVANEAGNRFRLCQLAAAVIERADRDARTARRPAPRGGTPDLTWARELLAVIEGRIANGDQHLRRLVPAVHAEIAVAAAEGDADAASAAEQGDPLFRLRIERWALVKDDLADLMCARDPRLRVLAFDFDVAELMSVRDVDDLAVPPASRRSYIVAFGHSDGRGGGRRDPLVVDGATARILQLSDRTRSASEIVAELNREGHLSGDGIGLKWIENLFAHGLILLRENRLDPARDVRPAVAEGDQDVLRERGAANSGRSSVSVR